MFFDVHSHVVPSGDDGAPSVADGLDLCRAAAERGTSVLYATPHVWPELPLDEEREERIRGAHASMAEAAAEFALDLRLGFEVTPAPALLDDDPARYTLGGLPAVLMELPFHEPLALAEAVAEHIAAAGLVPVIAHPERADAFIAAPEATARRYLGRGWLLQVNGTSLLGYHGPDREATGWLLVDRGLASLVASDGHRPARPPFLDAAYAAVRNRAGEEAADRLFRGVALEGLARPDRFDLAERS